MSDVDTETLVRDLIKSPNNHCFGCGHDNPAGLRLTFERQDGIVRAPFEPGQWHEGWIGVIHGGLLAAALDEAMAYALYYTGVKGLTARMEVRFRAPVHRGDSLEVEARVTRDTRRLVDIEGRLLRDGDVVAESFGRFMKLGPLDPTVLE
jgi:acyl-coenzyme A thioesterase PaaI-like protein